MSYLTYLEIQKVFIENHATNLLFDIRKKQYMNQDTGLTLDIMVYEDFTDLIINNESIFARAIYLDFIISFLHGYATTLRSNANEILTDQVITRAVMEIEGSGSDGIIPGIRPMLGREIAQIKKEIKKLKEGYFGGQIQVYTLD